MVVVFLQDVQANYLLASNAGGRMPGHLQLECGPEGAQDISSLETSASSDQSGKPPNSHKKRAFLVAQAESKKLRTKMDTCFDKMDKCFDMISSTHKGEQHAPAKEAAAQPVLQHTHTMKEFTSSTEVFKALTEVNHAFNDTETFESMSPQTRAKYLLGLQTRRERLINKLLEFEQKEASES